MPLEVIRLAQTRFGEGAVVSVTVVSIPLKNTHM